MRQPITKPEHRLLVALDVVPGNNRSVPGRQEVRSNVLNLARQIKGTGVGVKVNAPLRACGYGLIDMLHGFGLTVFADLKLFDIGETLERDAMLLQDSPPEFLTVVCSAGPTALTRLTGLLPKTEVLGVTVLTSMSENECSSVYGFDINTTVISLAGLGVGAHLDGFVASPKEASALKRLFKVRGGSHTINTPGIRPHWSTINHDDQNQKRVMTPADAIKAGADRIIVGRPIVQHHDPRGAVIRTLEEITGATCDIIETAG